ncbi:hypothetical protein T439DRAFT_304637 [Meredithblackwellia eburnea MCA 4105]
MSSVRKVVSHSLLLYVAATALLLVVFVSLASTSRPLHSYVTVKLPANLTILAPKLSFPSFGGSSSSSRRKNGFRPILRDQSASSSSSSRVLAYREHLEETTSIPSLAHHSPTLTFDHIYLLSLPSRLDRREQIGKLARAHGLEVTFVDAAYKNEPFMKWIAERAAEVRVQRLKLMAKAQGVPAKSIGGLHVGNPWTIQTADLAGDIPFPPLPDVAPEFAPSWIDHLHKHIEAGTLSSLVPKDPNLNITKALYDPVEKILGRQVNEGVISTFFGHTKAMRLILENGDKSALILEDDVDVEWDLERLWGRMEHKLKDSGWEMALLGHCWGRELLRPQYLHPHLHASVVPLCLHAYALTNDGARHLLSLLENPWTAYQTAVDTAVPSFISFGIFKSFSVEPTLVVQRKDGPSDIQEGVGSIWHGLLMDSTVERIARSEGEEVVEEEFHEGRPVDPALVWRYGKRPCAE